MRSFRETRLVLIGAAIFGRAAAAQPVIIDSDIAAAYHFVDHYEILIDRPVADVWPHVLDIGTWMDAFDNVPVSGTPQTEGAVIRLYEGQDFVVEIAKIVPEKLLVIVNHPSVMDGEIATGGISMLTLTDVDGQTLVANFMSRQYYWPQPTTNPLRARRESAEYQAFNREIWQDRLLPRLRELAEGAP